MLSVLLHLLLNLSFIGLPQQRQRSWWNRIFRLLLGRYSNTWVAPEWIQLGFLSFRFFLIVNFHGSRR